MNDLIPALTPSRPPFLDLRNVVKVVAKEVTKVALGLQTKNSVSSQFLYIGS